MRDSLIDPISDKAKLAATEKLVKDLYRLHEAGRPYATEIQQLAHFVDKKSDEVQRHFRYAFGSVSPDTFACQLLVDWNAVPRDLSKPEMLELLSRIFRPSRGEEFLTEYWLKCLRINTKNDRISDLIFWPGDYFRDGDDGRELTPEEVLEIALLDAEKH